MHLISRMIEKDHIGRFGQGDLLGPVYWSVTGTDPSSLCFFRVEFRKLVFIPIK